MTKKTTSPYLLFRKRLRKATAYQTERSLATGTALINTILAALAALYLITQQQIPLAIFTAITGSLFWLLLNALAQTLFDLADTKLEHLHRQALTDSQQRNPQD
jgi:hypothetical protein